MARLALTIAALYLVLGFPLCCLIGRLLAGVERRRDEDVLDFPAGDPRKPD